MYTLPFIIRNHSLPSMFVSRGCQEERWNKWAPILKTQTQEDSWTVITLFPEEQRDSAMRLAHCRATCGSVPIGWISVLPSKTKTALACSCCQGYCYLSLNSLPKEWRRRHNCFQNPTCLGLWVLFTFISIPYKTSRRAGDSDSYWLKNKHWVTYQ